MGHAVDLSIISNHLVYVYVLLHITIWRERKKVSDDSNHDRARYLSGFAEKTPV